MILAGEKISAPKAAGETEAGAEGGELTRHIRFARDACRGGGRTRRAWIRQTRGTISSRVGVDTRRVNLRRGGLSTTRATRLPVHLSRGRMNHNPRPETGNGGSEATLPAVPTVVAAGNKEFPTKTEGENARRLARDALATSATRGAPFPGALRVDFLSCPPRKTPRGKVSGGCPPPGAAWARRPTSTRSRDRHRLEHAWTRRASSFRGPPARSSRRRDPVSRGTWRDFLLAPPPRLKKADVRLAPQHPRPERPRDAQGVARPRRRPDGTSPVSLARSRGSRPRSPCARTRAPRPPSRTERMRITLKPQGLSICQPGDVFARDLIRPGSIPGRAIGRPEPRDVPHFRTADPPGAPTPPSSQAAVGNPTPENSAGPKPDGGHSSDDDAARARDDPSFAAHGDAGGDGSIPEPERAPTPGAWMRNTATGRRSSRPRARNDKYTRRFASEESESELFARRPRLSRPSPAARSPRRTSRDCAAARGFEPRPPRRTFASPIPQPRSSSWEVPARGWPRRIRS